MAIDPILRPILELIRDVADAPETVSGRRARLALGLAESADPRHAGRRALDRRLREEARRPGSHEQPPAHGHLSGARVPPRHARVLRHLLAGESEKEIARKLALSPHTVHEYVKEIYRRLGVGSRAELVAARLGVARPPRAQSVSVREAPPV